MSYTAHTENLDGLTLKVIQDEDGSYANPRDNDGNFLFIGFDHRNYNIGDEQVTPESIYMTCPDCEGNGRNVADDTEPVWDGVHLVEYGENAPDCQTCEGEGVIYPTKELESLLTIAKQKYNARVIMPVSMYDHGMVSYSVGLPTDRWDSGICGLIMETEETMRVSGRDANIPEETIIKWMQEEIKEYSMWASGEVYGYVIEDEDGDHLDSCWGFIGEEYAIEEGKAALESERKYQTAKRIERGFTQTDLERWMNSGKNLLTTTRKRSNLKP